MYCNWSVSHLIPSHLITEMYDRSDFEQTKKKIKLLDKGLIFLYL